MLKRDDTVLVVIDVQEKLASVMYEREALIENVARMIRGAQILDIPIIWMEQNPAGLGATVPEVAGLLGGLQPIEKRCFGCGGVPAFMERLRALERTQVLICGIEAHVCVYQTAVQLREARYEVQVPADAVSSRTLENRRIGLARVCASGGSETSVETALFELLGSAEGRRPACRPPRSHSRPQDRPRPGPPAPGRASDRPRSGRRPYPGADARGRRRDPPPCRPQPSSPQLGSVGGPCPPCRPPWSPCRPRGRPR